MHTFEIITRIMGVTYHYLYEHLPSLIQVSERVSRTNFYAGKGITQIELRTYEYPSHNILIKQFYLALRCNPSIIMGDSKTFLVDLEKYSADEILERLQHRLYEINEFRFIKLDKLPVSIFQTNRADIAVDILVDHPEIIIWLANMSFCKYRNMERIQIKGKPTDTAMFESCCFANGSRKINSYFKKAEILNNGKAFFPEEKERLERTVRFEIQIKKKGIYGLKLPEHRSIKPFLECDFCHSYIEKEVCRIFQSEPFVSKSNAIELIQNSSFKPYDKVVMESIVNMILQFNGLFELEKAIADKDFRTPIQFGNIRIFRENWLVKFQKLGIQPVTIPDSFGIEKMPSIYELLKGVYTL